MRYFSLARRAGVPAAVVALGVLAAGPAQADVTVSPASAPQGSGQNLTLTVTNDGDKPVRQIVLSMPDDTALAEVFPLSIDNWAPKIEMRDLPTALPGVHGSPVTETARAITWIAMPGRDLAPGATTQVKVAVGPLPTLSSVQLNVTTRYADGKPGAGMSPATLALTPAQPGQALPQHHGGPAAGGGDAGGISEAEAAVYSAAVTDAERGQSFWTLAGWVVAGLILLGGGLIMLRNRHRAEEDDEPDEDESASPATQDSTEPEAREPVAAGKWSLKE